MNNIAKKPLSRLGYDFIDHRYIPEGKDEFYLRDEQHENKLIYRKLTAHEIEVLVKNENTADDWTSIYVTNHFNPNLVKSCQFYGMVRIGALGNFYLEFHDLQLPVGLYNSTIVSCDIGNNVVINNVNFLSHYQIGNEAILVNINEMVTSNHAKFGNGILKEDEGEDVRIWLEVGNENGGRAVMPFDGMLPGDAYLWSKYRDDKKLMQRFGELTDKAFDSRRGAYGQVGDRSIIKNCLIIKDVKVGSDAYIKGGNKLKNLTIKSSPLASSQIGEGVELVNGIIGFGCRIFYGVKAVRFMMGTNSQLKYGARLINSYLGDNATISCCEVLNSLIFPAHEQHHNNSFLCASTVMGQANMAAGATIGSNHNSRGNDGEITAHRGFWPGLCVSLKHNSYFASFCLISKGSYQFELNVSLPFALVMNNETDGELEIMPAYWFMYNMYALARNSWKHKDRDKRIVKHQNIEFDYLAPDSVEEIFEGMLLLEEWTAVAYLKAKDESTILSQTELQRIGREQLTNHPKDTRKLDVFGKKIEASARKVRILKGVNGYRFYREIVHYYGIKTLVNFVLKYKIQSLEDLKVRMTSAKRQPWVNIGGQLIQKGDLDRLRLDINNGKIDSWTEVHEEYKMVGVRYYDAKAEHAFASLLDINYLTITDLTQSNWEEMLDAAVVTQDKISKLTRSSREKDYSNPYRKITYDNQQEMEAVVGTIEDNEFIHMMAEEAQTFQQKVEQVKSMEVIEN